MDLAPSSLSPMNTRMLRHVVAGALLVTVVLWALVAEASLILDDITALVPAATVESLDGSGTCAALYDEFRRQAHSHGLAAIPMVLLAALASVLVAVVVPFTPGDDEADRRSLMVAIKAQPRVPLVVMAALFWTCAHHHVSTMGEARELAAMAVDAMTTEPVPKDEAVRRTCLALRAAWERQRSEAASALAYRMNDYGMQAESDQLAADAAMKGHALVSHVGSRAQRVVDADDAPAAEKQKLLRELLDDHADVTSSVTMVELAVDAAAREGAPKEDVERWRTGLDEAKVTAEIARREGEQVLAVQPTMAPPQLADVEEVPEIASEVVEAAETVKSVSHEVEGFLRGGDDGVAPAGAP